MHGSPRYVRDDDSVSFREERSDAAIAVLKLR
jgi:hypothetical protein